MDGIQMNSPILVSFCKMESLSSIPSTRDWVHLMRMLAYKKPEAASLKIAKLAAVTVLILAVILGTVVLGAVYIQTKNQCVILPQTVSFDPIAAESAPVAEALHGRSDDSSREEINLFDTDKFRIPLQLDIDDLTGQMMENNQRARVNCLIEKKKAEEIVTQTPKHLRTPFGNLTTDHRYMHVTGETMSLSCRSGNAHSIRPIPSDDEPVPAAAAIIQVQPVHHPIPAQARMQGGPASHQHHQQPMQPMHHQHPVLGHPMMMGPGGPMGPPPHFLMNPQRMDIRDPRDPRMEQHFRAKRRVKQCACACDC